MSDSVVLLTNTNRTEVLGNKHMWLITIPQFMRERRFQVELLQVNWMHKVYPVNVNNNTFHVQLTDAAQAIRTVTIAPGSYTPTTFVTALTAALNASGGATYTVSYDSTTYKLTITSTVTFRFIDRFDQFGNENSPITITLPAWRLLGMSLSADLSLFGFSTSKTSSVPIDISGSVHVRIVANIYESAQCTASRHYPCSLLVPLPAFGELVNYEMTNQVMVPAQGVQLDRFTLEFVDDTNSVGGYVLADVDHISVLLRLTLL